MLADYHVHTAFSDDSPAPMEDMVRRALALGLEELCFTEHVDYGVKTVVNCDYAAYFSTLDSLRQTFAGQITLRSGAEFGVQTSTAGQFAQDAAEHPFDFLLLSCHQIDNLEFCRGAFQEGRSQKAYQTAYYTAIWEVMRQYRDYSVLGHLDLIKRYDAQGPYPDQAILPLTEQILRQAIADGKGLEVNTSGLRYGLGDFSPSRPILEQYRRLGGEIITVGSDAHTPDRLADHLKEAQALLRDIGFRWVCTFSQRQPCFHPL